MKPAWSRADRPNRDAVITALSRMPTGCPKYSFSTLMDDGIAAAGPPQASLAMTNMPDSMGSDFAR
jgi:hypothetical protein